MTSLPWQEDVSSGVWFNHGVAHSLYAYRNEKRERWLWLLVTPGGCWTSHPIFVTAALAMEKAEGFLHDIMEDIRGAIAEEL